MLSLAALPPPQLGAVAIRCDALGWRIRVPIARSQTLAAQAVKAEPLIRKGDQVEIQAQGGAFTVSAMAVAEQDGAVGDRIRVRDPGGRKGAIIAQVTAEGRVTLPAFN